MRLFVSRHCPVRIERNLVLVDTEHTFESGREGVHTLGGSVVGARWCLARTRYVDMVFTRYLLLANIALAVCACRAEKQALDFE